MSNNPKNATKAKKSDRSFITIIGILLAVGVAVIAYVALKPKTPAVITLDPNAKLPAPQGVVAGSEAAPVEIVEFGDFECPQCGRFATITEYDVRTRLIATGLARFRFIDFPLNGHPTTRFAHNAAACANEQGKFWEMHDRIFLGQTEWSELVNGRNMNPAKIMKRYAKELGLDTKKFDECLDTQRLEPQIRANFKEGERLGVNSTPTFFIGKRMVVGAQAYDVIKAAVDSATADAKKAAADSAKAKPAAPTGAKK